MEAPSATGLADYLLQDERSAPGDRDQAIVFEIAPLGLWFAHEGKNRVHFLRSGGAIEMPAMVTTIDYRPPAGWRSTVWQKLAGRRCGACWTTAWQSVYCCQN